MMNCDEVRERFSAPSRGGAGLTELALVHAHVEQCADCRAARASPELAGGSLPRIEPSRGAAVSADSAHVIGRLRFVIAPVARSLISLRSSLLSAFQATPRAASEAAGAGATRLLAGCARLTRAAGALPTLFMPVGRAAADLAGRARFVSARVPRLLIRLGSALMIAGRGSARAASERAGIGTARLLGLPSRLGALAAISSKGLVGAAGTVVVAGRTGAMRTLGMLFRAGARVPVLVARSTRAVGRVVVMAPSRAWAYPKVCAGVASLAILVASLVVLGPPHWPDDRVRLRDVRAPVDRKPAAPAVVAPLVHTAPPATAAAPRPIPVPAPRVAAPEARAAVPAPVRRSAVYAPQPPAEAARNGEASDPAAAIDWLLQGSARRHAERP
jgi:hypothetical protein